MIAKKSGIIEGTHNLDVKPKKVAEMAENSVATIYKYYFKNTTPDELFDTVAAAI